MSGRTFAFDCSEAAKIPAQVAPGEDKDGQAEAGLQLSEERYRALVEASACACWRAMPNGLVTEVTGLGDFPDERLAELVGGKWLAAVHADDRERAQSAWESAVNSGEPLLAEYRIEVGGNYRWVQPRAVALKRGDGSVREWVGTVADIHERKQAEAALRSQEERYQLAARATSDTIWDWDLATDRVSLGLPGRARDRDEASGAWWINAVHPDDRGRVVEQIYRVIRSGAENWSDTYRFRRDDGSYAEIFDRGFVVRDDHGAAVRMVGAAQDISERKQAGEALRATEDRLRLALRAGRMVPWELDLPSGHLTHGETALGLLGIASGNLRKFLRHIQPEDRHGVESFLTGVGVQTAPTCEFRYTTPSGTTMWLGIRAEKSGTDQIIGVTFDITDRKRIEEEVWRAANHDFLTGLPNRSLFQSRFEQALNSASQNDTSVSLLILDLDNFKDLNDTLGHHAGDAILKEVAGRLSYVVRESDTVARLGGDEFALVIVEPLKLEHAERLAEALIEKLRQPIVYEGAKLSIRASIGLASYPEHDRCPRELMKDADIALYRAKAEGRNRAVTFNGSLRSSTEQRVLLFREMREEVAEGRIVPFYQPKVCLTTGRIVGFEALARWLHPSKGVLTPGAFAPALEDPELALLIGSSIKRQVARDIRHWLDRGLDCGRVGVNFSSAEFAQPNLAEIGLNTIAMFRVPEKHLEIEVTETVFMGRDAEQTAATLRKLHDSGMQVALDDFGTGFASLTHLKQFPVDHIKIDRSFICDLERGTDDGAIVDALIGLGRSLRLQVTAEGVETFGQERLLRQKGCAYAQGYLYAKPMAASRVSWFLENWNATGPRARRGLWPRAKALPDRIRMSTADQ